MLDFSWESLKPEYPQIAMCLARARRARVTLRLAVQCGLAPSCTLPLFLVATFFYSLFVFDGTIDCVAIAIVSVKSGILFVFVGEFNTPPLAQVTCTTPVPVPLRRWGLLI